MSVVKCGVETWEDDEQMHSVWFTSCFNSNHTPLKCSEENTPQNVTLAARAMNAEPMKECSVSGREGSGGFDWAHSGPWLSWLRRHPGEEWTHWATLSPFQAWKAHLMGRDGCKQNSRRTAVSQRTQPAQGTAFIHLLLPPTLPRPQCECYRKCLCHFMLQPYAGRRVAVPDRLVPRTGFI